MLVAARFVLRLRSVDLGLLVSLGELVMVVPVAVFALWKRRAGWGALGFRRFDVRVLGPAIGLLALAYVFNVAYGLALAQFHLQTQIDLAPIFALDALVVVSRRRGHRARRRGDVLPGICIWRFQAGLRLALGGAAQFGTLCGHPR